MTGAGPEREAALELLPLADLIAIRRLCRIAIAALTADARANTGGAVDDDAEPGLQASIEADEGVWLLVFELPSCPTGPGAP